MISREYYPLDVVVGGVGAYFVASTIPSMNPIHAAIFGVLNTLVQYPVEKQVVKVIDRYGQTAYEIAVAMRARMEEWPSLEGVNRLIDRIVQKTSRHQVAKIMSVALTYLASAFLTTMCMSMVGIPFGMKDALLLSTSAFILVTAVAAARLASRALRCCGL